jgi:hypothetical protein
MDRVRKLNISERAPLEVLSVVLLSTPSPVLLRHKSLLHLRSGSDLVLFIGVYTLSRVETNFVSSAAAVA